ncbi:GIY-YIG nuclease family protein [Secundilactobacillus malefermentans]|uniref:GIY-YIG nuclease family protein n=1 Tax=Secundilactobacillus malefermentans TaxID=176292 RepID=UPI0011C83A9B|nr:GIY-YIG nuclease family protein [Secundilactobacillus malefermentans]QEA32264.1 GIY-YIG nuclease family protein [Secundilactobacillus malefermentans]
MEEKTKKFYFYVLLCADDTLYGGFSTDVFHRLEQHESGQGAKYTRPKFRHPLKLIYYEEFPTKSLALKAEYAFKHQPKYRKLEFLADHHVTF